MKRKRKRFMRLSLETILLRLKNVAPHVTLDVSTFVDLRKKARFIDDEYGEWLTSPGIVLHGHKHPARAKAETIYSRTVTVDEAKRRVFQAHGDELTLDETTWVNASTKARFVDKVHGEWWAFPKVVFQGHKHLGRSGRKKVTLALVKQYLHDTYNNEIYIDEATWVNGGTSALFIDKRYNAGEWWAKPCNVIQGMTNKLRGKAKSQATCVRKWGVPNPMMAAPVLRKANNLAQKVSFRKHWKTGKRLLCRGSWEVAFVLWCRKHKINFEWQIPQKMPNGRTYVVDALIKSGQFANTYVELKGFWRNVEAKQKWEWFHVNHPHNSQLWMKNELFAHGVLVKKKRHKKQKRKLRI